MEEEVSMSVYDHVGLQQCSFQKDCREFPLTPKVSLNRNATVDPTTQKPEC